jgi:ribulose-5-phosphate 4-epimerase/fuculose-1-phosphate aldolase
VSIADFRSEEADATHHPGEMRARTELAACYRLIAHFGMDDLAFTHISARVPGTEDQFLINPFGLLFHEVTASSLVKIDHQGNFVEASSHQVNKAGFVIHSAIHMAKPEINCVLHTHTRAGVAVSCLADGLQPLNQWALMFKDRIGYHEYEGIALSEDERERLVEDLGDRSVLILRNHGLLTAGRSVPEAFRLMYYLEQACRVQLDVLALGAKIWRPAPRIADKAADQYRSVTAKDDASSWIEWPGLIRLLDRIDPSYRA